MKTPEEYKKFCEIIVQEINFRYGENGVKAKMIDYDTDVYIEIVDKSGVYVSTTSLEWIDMKYSMDINIDMLLKKAAQNFFYENFLED